MLGCVVGQGAGVIFAAGCAKLTANNVVCVPVSTIFHEIVEAVVDGVAYTFASGASKTDFDWTKVLDHMPNVFSMDFAMRTGSGIALSKIAQYSLGHECDHSHGHDHGGHSHEGHSHNAFFPFVIEGVAGFIGSGYLYDYIAGLSGEASDVHDHYENS